MRKSLDEALLNMFSSEIYKKNALFYAHIISQMEIILDDNLPAPAGVLFSIDHYQLYINEKRFSEFSLNDRIFILIHECLHVLNDHLSRFKDIPDKHHMKVNIATDCAINQLITLDRPTDGIFPDNFPIKDKQTVPLKASAEQYYELIKDDKSLEDSENSNGSGDSENSNGSGDSESPKTSKLDTHSTWKLSNGEKDLVKDVTKRMIDQSISETQKERGNLPADIDKMIDMFSRKAQVNWKKVLKNILGNKKIGTRRTIMKPSRRFPKRADIKGNTKDRKFNLIVFTDVSGSMGTPDIITGLNEIHEICKITKTSMKLIQIDTEVHKIETFTEKTKLFNRSGIGGTYMGAGFEYIYENKIQYDALIFISDMYIEDIREWKHKPNKRTMWLGVGNFEMPEWNGWNKNSVFRLKVNK